MNNKLGTNEIKNLLEKYQLGTCTKEEAKLIEAWLATVRNDGHQDFNDDFIDTQLGITKSKIDELVNAEPVIAPRRNFAWLKVAASFLVLGSAIAIWAIYAKKQRTAVVALIPGVEQHITNGWVYLQTQKGVTDHVKLPDGSLVTLGASSRLRYPTQFVNHKRPVYLDEGEGLFDVAKDKKSPFTVYTNKFATTALGTAFNIRSYASEHKVSISLIHGKIRVDDLHPTKKTAVTEILLPHQQVVLNKRSGEMVKSDFRDEAPITSWKDGVLSFQDATMDEVINSIENKFNVVIKNKSHRTTWSYTGTFKDETLADVIKTVCLTEGITYTINKNNITLN